MKKYKAIIDFVPLTLIGNKLILINDELRAEERLLIDPVSLKGSGTTTWNGMKERTFLALYSIETREFVGAIELTDISKYLEEIVEP